MEDKNLVPSNTLHNIPEKGVNSTNPVIPVTSPITRDEQGKFVSGVSGNPNGRPKESVPMSLLQKYRQKAEMPYPGATGKTYGDVLIDLEYADSMINPIVRKNLIDRLIGKATESIKIGSDGTAIPIQIVEVIRRYDNQVEAITESKPLLLDNNVADSAPSEAK